jgi:hypothetical protein
LLMSVIDVISGLPRSGRAHGEEGWMDHALGAVQEAGRTTGKEQRRAERLAAIRLRYAINTHLEDQGIATSAAIGAAAPPVSEQLSCV